MSVDPPGVRLRYGAERTEAVDALADRLEQVAGIEPLLDDLNRRARRLPAPGAAVGASLRWNLHDSFDRRWWPQGVTSTADAYDHESIAGRRLLAVSWYAKPRRGVRKGSRITFLDLDSRAYRHVLLVVPSLDQTGRLRLDPLHVHAGGIVWHANRMHIAATRQGLYTACLDRLLRVPDRRRVRDRDDLGIDGDQVATAGYRYVLPVCSRYLAESDDDVEPFRFSFVSLTRSPTEPLLVAGEYGRGTMTRRLATFAVDPNSGELVTDADGAAHPRLYDNGVRNMQGAVVADGTWYVTRSRGPWGRGSICAGDPDDLVEYQRALPMGPEDLTYWPSTDRLWTVSEWPGRRWVIGVDASQLRRQEACR
ncbi:hypothetical protein MU582_16940 [Nocardioidaceae bacterium SCSIO 66511]|nr:hypothetical protein MU582_16940 [Nocardioidaceae bacterium SCSIO 66511]